MGTTSLRSSGEKTPFPPVKKRWIFLYSAVVSSEQVVDFRGQRMSFPLSISVRGCGSVREQVVSALGSTTEYPFETVVELEAVPAEGWTFSHWEDPSLDRVNPAELVIAGPPAVTAVFTQGFATLTGTIEVRHIFSGPLHEGGTIAGPAAAPLQDRSGLRIGVSWKAIPTSL